MPPAVSTFGQQLYDDMQPLAYQDAQLGWPLLTLCGGMGTVFQPIDDLCRDTTHSGPGWSQVMDVDWCPGPLLPWLGQFVGVPVDAALNEASMREQIRAEGGMSRGRLAALHSVAQRRLTGTRTVVIRERDADASPTKPAYGITVITFGSETPDESGTRADLAAAKPAGYLLQYVVETGQDFETVRERFSTFDALRTAYSDFDAMRTDTP